MDVRRSYGAAKCLYRRNEMFNSSLLFMWSKHIHVSRVHLQHFNGCYTPGNKIPWKNHGQTNIWPTLIQRWRKIENVNWSYFNTFLTLKDSKQHWDYVVNLTNHISKWIDIEQYWLQVAKHVIKSWMNVISKFASVRPTFVKQCQNNFDISLAKYQRIFNQNSTT